MKASFAHIQLNVQNYAQHKDLYQKLAAYFEWPVIHDSEHIFGVDMGNEASIWFSQAPVTEKNNRDSDGLNHLGIAVNSRKDVDDFIENFMKPNKLEPLFETPRERTEFMYEGYDYYQVMFELPDAVLIEVVFNGQK